MMWINLIGLVVIGLIVWWFWLYQTKSTEVRDGSIEVRVKDGVYQPANITAVSYTHLTLPTKRIV